MVATVYSCKKIFNFFTISSTLLVGMIPRIVDADCDTARKLSERGFCTMFIFLFYDIAGSVWSNICLIYGDCCQIFSGVSWVNILSKFKK